MASNAETLPTLLAVVVADELLLMTSGNSRKNTFSRRATADMMVRDLDSMGAAQHSRNAVL